MVTSQYCARSLFFFLFCESPCQPGGRGPSILQRDPHQFPLSFACPDFERHWLTSPCAVAVQLAENRLRLLYPNLRILSRLAQSPLASPRLFLNSPPPIRALRHPNPAVCYSSPRPAYDVAASRRAQAVPWTIEVDSGFTSIRRHRLSPLHMPGSFLADPMRKRDIRPASLVSNSASSGELPSTVCPPRVLLRSFLNVY